MTLEELQKLVDELQTHQLALERQNEELRNAYVELADSRDRYSNLYEFAPVGYLTLDKTGRILESNLAAAKMLGVEKKALLEVNLSKFVARVSSQQWYLHRRAVFSKQGRKACEIQMRRADGTSLIVRVEGIVSRSGEAHRYRTALIDITQAKQAEDKLHELTKTLEQRVQQQTAQIRLQAEAIANLAEGVLITEGSDWLKSRIVFVNKAVSQITGYTARDLIGQPRKILNGGRPDLRALKRIDRALSAGKSCRAELIQYRKNGAAYHADLSVTPLPGNGGATNFVSIHRDITEWKRTEQALRASEQRFRLMADHAPVMIWISGLDKRCTYFNKPWLEFTGRPLSQQIGDGWTEGVHPEDLPECLKTYVTSFDAHKPFTMEYRLRRNDGEWRWVLDNGIPLYQDSGLFAGYIGSCIDVTERRQAEEALRASEERLRTILTTASDAVITIDRRGIIVTANPATERMFGYTQNQLIGGNVKLLMPAQYCEAQENDVARYLETYNTKSGGSTRETLGLRKNGSTFPVELAVSEIEDLGLLTGIYRDISARKQTEQALDQYRKDLQTMSSELMLAEERERQRLAQDLHDGLGQALFRAKMKVDQLSASDPLVGEVRGILEEMSRMANTLTFELSPPVLRLYGLRPAIGWLAKDMKQRYALSVRVNDDGEDYRLDERVTLVLFRSLRELLINVAKHAQTDEASLSLRRSHRSLQIEVEDKGKGFDAVDQSRQVESGHFGLFSVRERLEYLRGSFKIRSARGKGTKVTLTVPLAGKTANAGAVYPVDRAG